MGGVHGESVSKIADKEEPWVRCPPGLLQKLPMLFDDLPLSSTFPLIMQPEGVHMTMFGKATSPCVIFVCFSLL
jgi:hypothetical protein